MLSVNFNPPVLNAQYNLLSATNAVSAALDRMSTGFRINSAKDDAAGMFVAENLKRNIRGLKQAQINAENGIALINTAAGALSNMSGLLNRMRDLAVQGANGVYDASSRRAMQAEANALTEELYQIRDGTFFNGKQIFNKDINNEASSISTLDNDTVPSGYTAVYTAEDLNKIRDNLSGKYILMNDIDLTGVDWEPIADKTASFQGILDGGGFKIKNLKINKPGEENVGFFGYTKNAQIKNLSFTNADVSGGTWTGIVAGRTDNNTVLDTIYVQGRIFGTKNTGSITGKSTESTLQNLKAETIVLGQDNMGGISGFLQNTNVQRCIFSGSIRGNEDLGGIGGYLDGKNNISYCATKGSFYGTIGIGGIAGKIGASSNVIDNSYSKASINALNYGAGGIIGQVKDVNNIIRNCYADGKINCPNLAGGLTGNMKENNDIINSFWDKQKTGQETSDKGGTGLLTSEMLKKETFINAGWDESIWSFKKNKTPFLSFEKTLFPNTNEKDGNLRLQVGYDSEKTSCIYVDTIFDLGHFAVSFVDPESCVRAINDIDTLLNSISTKQSDFGTDLNRLESVLTSNVTTIENLSASMSTIMDADIALESAAYVKNEILQRTASALLTQSQAAHKAVITALIQ